MSAIHHPALHPQVAVEPRETKTSTFWIRIILVGSRSNCIWVAFPLHVESKEI